jgi:phosphoserine phosphatase
MSKSKEFIDSVLSLQPSLAVFDCDGTLWSGDAGERFFDWELNRGLVSDEIIRWARPRYAEYRAGKVDEDTMCGQMVTMHRGLTVEQVECAAQEFFIENFAQQIFPEMRTMVQRLQDNGGEVWAVSSTNEWVIRAAMKYIDIPNNRILAAAVEIDDGIVTDRLVRVPSGPGKTKAIHEVIGREPDAAFGNSRWDAEMLAIARHAFAVNPNADLAQIAQQRGWTIYFPNSIEPAPEP